MNHSKNYRLFVEILPPLSYKRWAQIIEIKPPYHKQFRPIRTTDDRLGKLLGELYVEEARPLKADRKLLASSLAAEITKSLLEAMEAEDTHNGYRLNKEDNHG